MSERVAHEPEGWRAVMRGFRGRCPCCGEGKLFGAFLKVRPSCARCGLEFHHHRADDFPPYIVMFIVGHLLGYGIYSVEMRLDGVPLWVHALLWPALAIGLCLAFLQPVKGFVIALQYALGMHGFGRPVGNEVGGFERREVRTADSLHLGPRPGTAAAEPNT